MIDIYDYTHCLLYDFGAASNVAKASL